MTSSCSSNDQGMTIFSESYFECPICINILLKPITLICGHNFCEECIKNEYFGLLKQQCPVCRKFILVNLRIIKVNLVLDLIVREYFKDNRDYQERRSAYNERVKLRKEKKIFQRWVEKISKKFIVISTYFRKCIPFITLGKPHVKIILIFSIFEGFAILLLYLVKYHLSKLDIRKLEASYTVQLNKIFSLIKNNNLVSEPKFIETPTSNSDAAQTTPNSSGIGENKQQNSSVDLQNLIFSKLIKYLFTNYIRLSLPLGVS